ncbi:MAG: MerR family DNA-binding transcriptional regulator, partial [Candidatus Thiodiazotropha taylori]
MLTVGQVAKRYQLSRSTLLYYDNKGVLKPSGRNHANYRV